MRAVGTKRQRFDAADGGKSELAVKMREQRAAARGLPFQLAAELGGIDAQQQEVALAGEMLGRGFGRLRRAGEMDEAVVPIDGRAAEHAACARLGATMPRADFVKLVQHARPAYVIGTPRLSRVLRLRQRHAEDCIELPQFVCPCPGQIVPGDIMLKIEEYLVETADHCIRLGARRAGTDRSAGSHQPRTDGQSGRNRHRARQRRKGCRRCCRDPRFLAALFRLARSKKPGG